MLNLKFYRNVAGGLNFFLLNANNTAAKLSTIVTEILTLKNFPAHPLNWQNEVPLTYYELGNYNENETISYQAFSRGKVVKELTIRGSCTWAGKYDITVYRQFIFYDDGGQNNNDQYAFTYPAVKLPSNFTFTPYAQLISTLTQPSIQQLADDIFEPGKNRLQILYPIINANGKSVGVFGLQFDINHIIQDIVQSKLQLTSFKYYEIQIYAVGKTTQQDMLIFTGVQETEDAYNLTDLKKDYENVWVGQLQDKNGTRIFDSFSKVYPSDYGYYVTRVFSPYNYTYDSTQRSKYNYMIVISANHQVDQTQKDEITTLIRPEMSDYLAYVVPSSIMFVLIANCALILFSEWKISRPIIQLAKQVQMTQQTNWQKKSEDQVKKMNEINKLRNIFATFFNEEIKEDAQQKSGLNQSHNNLNKKVEMIVEKPVQNPFYQQNMLRSIYDEVDHILDNLNIDKIGKLQPSQPMKQLKLDTAIVIGKKQNSNGGQALGPILLQSQQVLANRSPNKNNVLNENSKSPNEQQVISQINEIQTKIPP
eukprot:403333779